MKTKTGFDPESNVPQQLSAGEKKVAEYAARIQAGESRDDVLKGLPDVFKSGVEKKLGGSSGEVNQDVIPPQYVGLNSEVVDFMWTVPEYADPEKTKKERERKMRALAALQKAEREDEIHYEEKVIKKAEESSQVSALRQELGLTSEKGAKNSMEAGEDMENMSVEDFAEHVVLLARRIGIKINADGTGGAYDILTARPEFRGARVGDAVKDSSAIATLTAQHIKEIKKFHEDSVLEMKKIDGVEYISDKWDHFKIRDRDRSKDETHKGYITIDKDQVLTKFTPNLRIEIVKRLRDGGYNGQVKFPILGSRALFSYDNIVLHGNESSDVDRGLEIVQKLLSDSSVAYDAPRRGVDSKGADGKKMSYTERIAELVSKASNEPDFDFKKELQKIKA